MSGRTAQRILVHRVTTRGPGDVSGVAALLDAGLDPRDVIAVMGKTEGNGCVNDFTREYATEALCHLFGARLGIAAGEVHARIAFVMSGGTEGVLSPHLTVFARSVVPAGEATGEPRLAVGIAFTRDFLPHELGRVAQVDATADAVLRAMAEADIAPADVHFVQIKCPLLTSAKLQAAQASGRAPVTHDTYESMGYSRGASALGVAAALGEVDRTQLEDARVLRDWSLYSGVASTSSGIELDHNVVIVMGESRSAASAYRIGHGVMRDAIDAESVREVLRGLGLQGGRGDAERIVNVFAKAEASPDGVVRGARHTMLNDSDINSTRHARAAVGAVIASVVGRTEVYVSGGAEHQGPPGGGPFAVIVTA